MYLLSVCQTFFHNCCDTVLEVAGRASSANGNIAYLIAVYRESFQRVSREQLLCFTESFEPFSVDPFTDLEEFWPNTVHDHFLLHSLEV